LGGDRDLRQDQGERVVDLDPDLDTDVGALVVRSVSTVSTPYSVIEVTWVRRICASR
jgi:hypothetical protein